MSQKAHKFLKSVFYIVELLEMYLITHDHQFRLKSKHSTDMCIFTIIIIVKYYTIDKTVLYIPVF